MAPRKIKERIWIRAQKKYAKKYSLGLAYIKRMYYLCSILK